MEYGEFERFDLSDLEIEDNPWAQEPDTAPMPQVPTQGECYFCAYKKPVIRTNSGHPICGLCLFIHIGQ